MEAFIIIFFFSSDKFFRCSGRWSHIRIIKCSVSCSAAAEVNSTSDHALEQEQGIQEVNPLILFTSHHELFHCTLKWSAEQSGPPKKNNSRWTISLRVGRWGGLLGDLFPQLTGTPGWRWDPFRSSVWLPIRRVFFVIGAKSALILDFSHTSCT